MENFDNYNSSTVQYQPPNNHSTQGYNGDFADSVTFFGQDIYFSDVNTEAGPGSDVISKATVTAVENVINIGVLPVLVIMGVISNVINMTVFFRQGLADRINMCLFSLALADLGYLVFLMAGKAHSLVTLLDAGQGQRWKVTGLHTVVGVYWGFMSTSNALTMIISLERCACVVAPLHARRLLSSRAMAVTIAVVVASILGLYGVYNVKYVTAERWDPGTNTTVVESSLGSFYLQHRSIIDVIYNHILSITIPMTSLVVVIVSTVITVVQLRLSLAWRAETSSLSASDSREVALTKMLVAICCLYVVCVTPTVVKALLVELVPGFLPTGRYSNAFYVVNALMHVLTVLNASVNFCFYFTMGSRYRQTLLALRCCRCFRRKSPGEKALKKGEVSENVTTICTVGD